jgi:hypothetical protein
VAHIVIIPVVQGPRRDPEKNTMSRSLRDIHGMNRRPANGTPTSAPKPVPAAKPASVEVTHSCGHKTTVEKLAQRRCPACLHETHTKELKQAQKAVGKDTRTGRLPDGAVFHVAYDATKTLWTGTLAIDGQTFTGESSGVFKLLAKLDAQYRASLPKPAAELVTAAVHPA